MQRLSSHYSPLAPVAFPAFVGRQHYMHEFDPSEPTMPQGFEDYIPMVSGLCAVAKMRANVFVTVDEKMIEPGMSQRRSGPHVDGCFVAEKGHWGHTPGGSWNHYCNHVPMERMAVIVAASVAGCKAWAGEFDAEPRNDGDLSHIQLGDGEILPANIAYLLSPDCIHESMVFAEPTQRSFIRLALPR